MYGHFPDGDLRARRPDLPCECGHIRQEHRSYAFACEVEGCDCGTFWPPDFPRRFHDQVAKPPRPPAYQPSRQEFAD